MSVRRMVRAADLPIGCHPLPGWQRRALTSAGATSAPMLRTGPERSYTRSRRRRCYRDRLCRSARSRTRTERLQCRPSAPRAELHTSSHTSIFEALQTSTGIQFYPPPSPCQASPSRGIHWATGQTPRSSLGGGLDARCCDGHLATMNGHTILTTGSSAVFCFYSADCSACGSEPSGMVRQHEAPNWASIRTPADGA